MGSRGEALDKGRGLTGLPGNGGGSDRRVSPTRPTGPARPALVWSALAIVYVVWGSTYLAIRITVETAPPFGSAAARFLLAGVVLLALVGAVRGWSGLAVPRRALAASGLVGALLLAGGNGMVVLAEAHRVPSGVAALLVATVPLILVVLRTVTGDRPHPASLAGVLLGFAGLAGLVLSRGGGAAPVGPSLLVVLAATSWAVGSFLSPRLPQPADPFVASGYQMVIGALLLAVLGLATGEPATLAQRSISGRSWAALGYLALAGSLVAFTAYVWLLRHAPISLAATYAYVNPVVAVALGSIVVGEDLTPAVLISGGVIVAGVALVVSRERPGRRADPAGRRGTTAGEGGSDQAQLPVPGPAGGVVAAPFEQSGVDRGEER